MTGHQLLGEADKRRWPGILAMSTANNAYDFMKFILVHPNRFLRHFWRGRSVDYDELREAT
jgi:hypothetical protein